MNARRTRSSERTGVLRYLAHCHTALTSYGAQRLESSGWRTLGIGSLPAASEGFRALALAPAIGWSTYEARDAKQETVAELALAQPHWFAPNLRARIAALSASRLDLYMVADDGTPETTLRRLRDGRRIAVDAALDTQTLAPAGATLVARVVRDHDVCALASASVISPCAARRAVRGTAPCDANCWSQRLLDALLAQFAGADLAGHDSPLEPQLIAYSPPALRRLNRALRSLERSLDQRFAPLVRHQMPDGTLLRAERLGRVWRIELDGAQPAAVQRVALAAGHPIDVELMRQIGGTAEDGVLIIEGAIDQLACACAQAAVTRSGARAVA